MGEVNEAAIDQLASTPEDDLPPKSDVVGALLRDFRTTILRLRAAEERVRLLDDVAEAARAYRMATRHNITDVRDGSADLIRTRGDDLEETLAALDAAKGAT